MTWYIPMWMNALYILDLYYCTYTLEHHQSITVKPYMYSLCVYPLDGINCNYLGNMYQYIHPLVRVQQAFSRLHIINVNPECKIFKQIYVLYRDSPVFAVFGFLANRTIGKTTLSGTDLVLNRDLDFWIFKVHIFSLLSKIFIRNTCIYCTQDNFYQT